MVRKLFLTPPTLPGETQCRSVEIPSSQQWLGIFNQALLQLAQAYNYEQVNETDLTPEEVAAYCYQVYTAWIESTCSGGTGEIPTPFWDDVTDTDDQEPSETQPWYGLVLDPDLPPDELTFVENAGIWAFSGLLAVSGLPAAAILFQTTAPSFVLAMRGDDFGQVIRILIDGEDAAEVELSADPDELVEVPLYPDPEISLHDILIILREVL